MYFTQSNHGSTFGELLVCLHLARYLYYVVLLPTVPWYSESQPPSKPSHFYGGDYQISL